jgi:hypothetical protein
MKKIQKIGFISLPSIFILVGIACLAAGIATEDSVLKIMGASWLPLGILNLVLAIHIIKKEK